MTQNQAELERLIAESQDFPEVNVKKGVNCWNEELSYLIKEIFNIDKKLRITIHPKTSECCITYSLSDFPADYFLETSLFIGKRPGLTGMNPLRKIKESVSLIAEGNQSIIHEGRNPIHSPLTIKVYDSSFFEPAKLFAKTYTKWCGQEATVSKEYNSAEDKAKEIIRLEGMIGSSKEGKKENINQLEPETVIEKRPGHLYEMDLVNEAKAKVEEIIKNVEGSKKYKTHINNGISRNLGMNIHNWGVHRNSPSDYITSIRISFGEKIFLGAADMSHPSGSMHIEISELNFNEGYDKGQVKYKINVDVNGSKHLEFLTRVGTKLKEEFNAPLIIKPNY